MKTIRILLTNMMFVSVGKFIQKIYYKNSVAPLGSYRKVFDELSLVPNKVAKNGEKIIIQHSPNGFSVDLKMPGEKHLYSIDFSDWEYLVNIPIDKDALERYKPEEIVAHFLWEITFWGFTKEDIEKQAVTMGIRIAMNYGSRK